MTNIRIDHNLKFKTATLGCFLRLPLDKKTLALANILGPDNKTPYPAHSAEGPTT